MRDRPVDDEVLANVFARAYKDTGSIADAFWVTSAIVRRQATHDVDAAGLNDLVARVAHAHGLKPRALFGSSRVHAVCDARFEVWWLLRRRRLTWDAIAAAFRRDHSTIMAGVAKFDRMLEASAELRARMAWFENEMKAAA